ncbi:MAG: hypothetical protein GX799_05620 [Crenarchaeota archaeon]|nr:hypothetical protein [Thermoproteota archaeon]
MQEARGGLGVASVGDKVYAIGGSIQNGLYPPLLNGAIVSTNEEYDSIMDTWISKEPIPTARAYFAITSYQNRIYCFGGIIGVEQAPSEINDKILVQKYVLSSVNEVYDPATDTWETKTSMPNDRMNVLANVVGDKIYVIDGFSRSNEVYDPAADSWAIKTPLPYGGTNTASVVVDSKIYVIINDIYTVDENSSRRLFVYDTEKDVWSQATPPPSLIIDGPAVATIGVEAPKRVYALGVQLGNNPAATNYIYDPSSDNWTVGTPMTVSRIDFGVTMVNDTIFAVGGYTFDASPNSGKVTVSAANEQYTPAGYEKLDDSTSPGNLPNNQSQLPVELTVVVIGAFICVSVLFFYVRKRKTGT